MFEFSMFEVVRISNFGFPDISSRLYICVYTDKTTLRVIRRLWGGVLSLPLAFSLFLSLSLSSLSSLSVLLCFALFCFVLLCVLHLLYFFSLSLPAVSLSLLPRIGLRPGLAAGLHGPLV